MPVRLIAILMFDYRIFRRSNGAVMSREPGYPGKQPCVGTLLGSVVCMVLIGCGVPRVEPIEHLRGTGLDEPFPDASMAYFYMPFEKLDLVIPIAFKKQHWGLLRVKRSLTATAANGTSQRVLRAAALLPDGRTAQVVGWLVDSSRFAVAVRVGHFGDRDEERAFLGLLTKTLRTKLTRRVRFELSDATQEH